MTKLDQKRVHLALERAATTFDEADFFYAEIRSRLLERLELFRIKPQWIVDLGTGTGSGVSELKQRFDDASVIGIDAVLAMLQQAGSACRLAVCADSCQLPFPDNSIDLAFSNLAVQWFDNPRRAFEEIARVLRKSGLFMFTTLGPGSFNELRSAWAAVDTYAHVHDFEDMHNIGDALIAAGLRDPVMDMETVSVTYADPTQLADDLRLVGSTNSSSDRNPGLTGPFRWRRMLAAYDTCRDSAARYPVTMEVIYGHAWAGEPDPGVSISGGEARFPLSRLKHRSR
jgi:malonyl-CoA O-methyltransferase